MLISVNWLLELTPYSGTVEDLAKTLTMLGLEVEEQYEPYAGLRGLKIGRVLKCLRHPNADKLTLCKVDAGDEVLDIICGAPNVAPGQNVALAKIGQTLPQGMKIKKTKIRGVESFGMICSEKELGLSEDHSGIMVLDPGLEPGAELDEALGLRDWVFDLGITPNRADCFSVLGVAREVAAYFNLPLYLPKTDFAEDTTYCKTKIKIHRPDYCPLYQARVIEDLKVAQSPDWMRYRLQSIGVRSINNLVDITNYVLMETSQPLHAFDKDLLKGDTIQVGCAEKGRKFTTLDGISRELGNEDLLIWDSEEPVAIAGIMGGENTEIGINTRNVLLECAVFNPLSTRRTAKKLNISSEASFRFERGVDQPGSDYALARSVSLFQALAGGRVLKGVAKEVAREWAPKKISFRPDRAKAFLAVPIDFKFCESTLSSLQCIVEKESEHSLAVKPPSFRMDLCREEDLIEEVGRFYGLENIPAALPKIAKPLKDSGANNASDKGPSYEFLRKIKNWARGQGFNEAINYSFVSLKELEDLGQPEEMHVKVANPLTYEQDTLRSILVPSFLQNLRHNLGQGNYNLRFFEIGVGFLINQSSETGAEECPRLGLMLHGSRNPEHWPWKRQDVSYADIKGNVENLLAQVTQERAQFVLKPENAFLSPKIGIELGGSVLGWIGRIKQEFARDCNARSEVWIAELDLTAVYRLYSSAKLSYRSIPRFPPVIRDMTLIAGLDLRYEQIVQVVENSGLELLDMIFLQDIYQPEKAQERNFNLRMIYRHPEKTLTDKEVDRQHAKLGNLLLSSLPVRFP